MQPTIALVALQPLPQALMGQLQEAFSESNLPIRVDLVDFQTASPTFQEIIRLHHIPL